MIDPRTPCLVGVAQEVWRPGDLSYDLEPLDGWELVSRSAEADAGRTILPRIDSVNVVDCQSWRYDDPPSRLASRLGLESINVRYSSAGGTSPQVLMVDAASAIQRGESEAALVVGGELLASVRRYAKESEVPPWSFPKPTTDAVESQNTLDPTDVAYGIYTAPLGFSLFESSLRASRGSDLNEHRRQLAELLSPLTAVAAANPRAWFRVSRTPDELSTISADNRMVSYPYTKLMTAFMDVDMAAAVIVCSHELADHLDISLDRRVYLRGWGIAQEHDLVAGRGTFSASPAMLAAAGDAMTSAGIGVDDIEHLDLYSCFPVALEFAREALGLAAGDTRPLTVTGGLPYFGGPASNYTTHALAELVTRLRLAPTSFGLVSGVGMIMQKHAMAIYSATPGLFPKSPCAESQRRLDASPQRTVTTTFSGKATVVAYGIWHERDGTPASGLCLCDTEDGRRTYARLKDPDLLSQAEDLELVGSDLRVKSLDQSGSTVAVGRS